MEELDLRGLLQTIFKRWWIIAVITITSLLAVMSITIFYVVPEYQADTSLYVGKNTDNIAGTTDIAYNELLVNNQLVSDYREFIKSRLVTGKVISALGLKNITSAGLAAKIDVNSKKDTRIIEITVLDPNPALARDIANKTAEVFSAEIVTKILDVKNVQIIDVAVTPITPVTPNKKMNFAIALVLGLIIGIGVVLLIEYLDSTIKTPEDIKKHLDLPVIGTIPIFPDDGK